MLNHKDKRLWTVHEKQDLIKVIIYHFTLLPKNNH